MAPSNEWGEREAGEFRRPLYGTELPLAVASTFDGCCGVVTAVTVRGLSIEDIKVAWKQLSLHIPLVRLQIARSPGENVDLFEWVYNVPVNPQEEMEKWAAATFVPMSAKTQDEVRLAATYDRLSIAPVNVPDIKPVAKLFVGSTSAGPTANGGYAGEAHITLLSHHSITDARCQWMILDVLLSLASGSTPSKSVRDFAWGRNDVTLLPRPFQYAADLRKDGDTPPSDPFEILAKMEEQREAAGQPCLYPHIAHQPFHADWQNAKGPTITKIVKVSRDDYSLIHKVAKAHGATATSWLTVLLFMIQLKLNDNKDAKSVQCTGFPIDCRWRLGPSHAPYYGAAMELATLCEQDLDKLQGALQHFERSSDKTIPSAFWELGARLKSQVQEAKHNTASVAMADPVAAMFSGVLAANPAIWDLPMTYFTSMGKASDHVKPEYTNPSGTSVTVHDFVTHALVHNFSMVCFGVLEWEGELRIVVQLARSVYTDDFAEHLLATLRAMLTGLVERAATEAA